MGPETTIDPAQLARLLAAPEPVKSFQTDDVFTVQVYGVEDFNVQRRVGADGLVSIPLIGPVPVRGLTVEQLELQLARKLEQGGFVQDPQVAVTIISQPSLTVSVTGEVARPGTFAAFGRQTLGGLLAQAGGLKDTASTTVVLIRPALPGPIRVPLGPEPAFSPYSQIRIFPGDEIRAGKVGVIYVVGACKNQGAFPLKNTTPTTVINAVALAGGMGYEAAAGAAIFRTSNGRRIEIKINVQQILKGKSEDLALRADDILYIPSNKVKAAIKGGGVPIGIALASAYSYAHP